MSSIIKENGYKAAINGNSESTNPFTCGTAEHEYWMKGYDDAIADNYEKMRVAWLNGEGKTIQAIILKYMGESSVKGICIERLPTATESDVAQISILYSVPPSTGIDCIVGSTECDKAGLLVEAIAEVAKGQSTEIVLRL